MMRKIFSTLPWALFFYLFLLAGAPHALGGSTGSDEDLITNALKPNVLIILDNSNSMDEDFYGAGVASPNPGSKSAEARKILSGLISTYADSLRLGIMNYRLPADTLKDLYI